MNVRNLKTNYILKIYKNEPYSIFDNILNNIPLNKLPIFRHLRKLKTMFYTRCKSK